jgi:hypothetical protein
VVFLSRTTKIPGNDSFLTNPFQFIIIHLPHCHQTAYSIQSESVAK